MPLAIFLNTDGYQTNPEIGRFVAEMLQDYRFYQELENDFQKSYKSNPSITHFAGAAFEIQGRL